MGKFFRRDSYYFFITFLIIAIEILEVSVRGFLKIICLGFFILNIRKGSLEMVSVLFRFIR